MRPQDRLDSPEGMRAGRPLRRTLRVRSIVAIGLVSALFSIAIGNETASLTVSNLTPHRVDVVVADSVFAAVAPGAKVTYTSAGAARVSVKASYAPGQDVEGAAERTFRIEPYHAAYVSSTSSGFYFACSSGDRIISPAGGGPVSWGVTPDTLARR